MGHVEQNIIRQAVRNGEAIPDRILNAPSLISGLNLYFDAFFDLNSERALGMAVGPIGWNVIYQYAKAYEYDEYQSQALFYFIKRMDAAYLDHFREKHSAK